MSLIDWGVFRTHTGDCIGVMAELNPAYVEIAHRRIATALFGPNAMGVAA